MNFDYEIMPLFKNYKIALSKKHKFTTDSVLLYDFSKTANIKRLCDLCSGTGIVAFLHNFKNPNPPIFTKCVEIDDEACFLMEKTLDENQSRNIEIEKGDLRQLKRPNDKELFDTVTCNPPYFKENTGKIGECVVARQEMMCNMDDVVASANRLLKFGGRLFLCQRPERLCDIIVSMRNVGIEPKRLRFAQFSEDKEPFLVLVEGKKGSAGGIRVMKNLYISKNGEYTEEYKKLAAME